MDSFEISTYLSAPPEIVYRAWLDSQEHSRMTGGEARVSAVTGETFEAWDGYIRGRNLELEPYRRIVQTWRTAEFSPSEKDSKIEILLEPQNGGTLLILIHTDLPAHGMQYKQGWVDNYFEPMQAYFLADGNF
jgi:uncharacterized protein YndB with AHSA1/START domain